MSGAGPEAAQGGGDDVLILVRHGRTPGQRRRAAARTPRPAPRRPGRAPGQGDGRAPGPAPRGRRPGGVAARCCGPATRRGRWAAPWRWTTAHGAGLRRPSTACGPPRWAPSCGSAGAADSSFCPPGGESLDDLAGAGAPRLRRARRRGHRSRRGGGEPRVADQGCGGLGAGGGGRDRRGAATSIRRRSAGWRAPLRDRSSTASTRRRTWSAERSPCPKGFSWSRGFAASLGQAHPMQYLRTERDPLGRGSRCSSLAWPCRPWLCSSSMKTTGPSCVCRGS